MADTPETETPTPAPEQTPEPEYKPRLTRADMMNELAEARNQEFETENDVKIDRTGRAHDPDTGQFVSPEEAARGEGGVPSEETVAEAEGAGPAEPQPAAPAAPSPKHKILVDGREEELTTDELIALAQKGRSADRAYHDAQRTYAEAQRLREEAQRQTQPAAPPQAQPQTPTAGEGDDLDQLQADLEAAYLSGDKEALGRFVAAIRRNTPQTGPAVDPAEIETRVRDAYEMDAAMEVARSEYPELYQDVDAATMATNYAYARRISLLKEAFRDNPNVSPNDIDRAVVEGGLAWLNAAYARAHRLGKVGLSTKEVFREAGNYTRQRLGLGSQRPEEPKTVTVQRPAAEAAKASATVPPAPRSVRARLGGDQQDRSEEAARLGALSEIRRVKPRAA